MSSWIDNPSNKHPGSHVNKACIVCALLIFSPRRSTLSHSQMTHFNKCHRKARQKKTNPKCVQQILVLCPPQQSPSLLIIHQCLVVMCIARPDVFHCFSDVPPRQTSIARSHAEEVEYSHPFLGPHIPIVVGLVRIARIEVEPLVRHRQVPHTHPRMLTRFSERVAVDLKKRKGV